MEEDMVKGGGGGRVGKGRRWRGKRKMSGVGDLRPYKATVSYGR